MIQDHFVSIRGPVCCTQTIGEEGPSCTQYQACTEHILCVIQDLPVSSIKPAYGTQTMIDTGPPCIQYRACILYTDFDTGPPYTQYCLYIVQRLWVIYDLPVSSIGPSYCIQILIDTGTPCIKYRTYI